jgi:outer membrane protein assembly factor BamC
MNTTGMKTATLLICLLLALSGCSSLRAERTDYKEGAAKGRPLDVPPDLVLPRSDDKYTVPDGGVESSATYSDYSKGGTAQDQSCPCKTTAVPQSGVQATAVPPPAPVEAPAPPFMQNRADGSSAILIAEPFERCWYRVGQALDRAAIKVEDKDRSKGLFYLKEHNQVSVQSKQAGPDKAAACEVTATNASGVFGGDSRRIIDALYKALGK